MKISYQESGGTLIAPSGLDSGQGFVADPTGMVDQDGHSYAFTLDPANPSDGLVSAVKDPSGATWSTSYDAGPDGSSASGHGLVVSQSTPGNGAPDTTSFGSFDPSGLPQAKTDPGGSGQPGGGVTHYAYDKLGNLLAVTDPRGAGAAADPSAGSDGGTRSPYTTYFGYDDLSRVTHEVVPKDSSNGVFADKSTSYDANGNVTSRVDGNGQASSYGYAPMDWLASGTDPNGNMTTYGYDEQGDKLDEMRPLANQGQPGHETKWTYDGAGQMLVADEVNNADSDHLTSYAYDNRGDQVGVADPVDNARLSLPGDLARVEQNASPGANPASPAGSSWRAATAYDAAGDAVQRVTNPGADDGRRYTTRRQYDADGSLLAVQDARGTGAPALGSDGLGGFSLSDGNGGASADHTAAYGYDQRELLISQSDPMGNRTQYARQADGKVCGVLSPRGSAADTMTVAYHRDAAGYPVRITDARGSSFTNKFFDTGDLMSTSRPSWWTYDPRGSGAPGPDPNAGGQGGSSSSGGGGGQGSSGGGGGQGSSGGGGQGSGSGGGGGGQGQVGSDTPGGGLVVREKTPGEMYKAAKDASSRSLPSSKGQGMGGEVPAQSPPPIVPAAGATSDGTNGTSFGYDGEMRLTKVTDEAGSQTNLSYDPAGRLQKLDRPFDGSGRSVTSYAYDADGNMASSTSPLVALPGVLGGSQRQTTSYGYDQLDRRVMVSAPGSNDAPQPAGGTPPSGAPAYCAPPMSPAQCGEPAPKPEVTRTAYALAPASVGSVPGLGGSFDVAERVSVTDPRGNTSMKDYDAVGNLVRASSPPVAHAGTSAAASEVSTYEYDQDGERTAVVRPLGNQSLPAQDRGYATTSRFDAAGRMSSSVDGQGHQTSYAYDPDGNLSQVRGPGASDGSSDQQVTSYTYNGRDLPASTQTGQSGDGSLRTTVSEYDPNGSLRRTVSPAGVDDSTQGSPKPYQGYAVGYSDPRGLGGASDPATSAAGENVDATIRVYDADNVLTNVFQPWGCRLGANDSKSQCQAGQAEDKRRFRQDFTVSALGRTTKMRESFDWTNPSSYDVTTSYGYMPNGWISREDDPKLSDAGSSQFAPKSSAYSYDPAGDQTSQTVEGQAMGGPSDRTVSSSYWPDGRVYDRTGTGPRSGHREDRYYYLPTGERSFALAALDGGGLESARSIYDGVGRLLSTNDTTNGMSGSGGGKVSPFDTVQAYDMDGKVRRRQANGSIYPTAAGSPVMYQGGQSTSFEYDSLDRETGMSVAPNPDAASSDPLSCPTSSGPPCRTFMTSFFPSGQVKERTRGQGGGQPIAEDCAYNDDGSVQSDKRTGGDQKSVSYSYDVNGNRTGDERGTHVFNALDQEVHWTRGGPDTQNPGSTVDYLLDGTGGMLQQKSHTVQSSTQSGTPVTATSDSTADMCSQATASAAQSDVSACQHDSDRVENATTTSTVTASGGGQTQSKTMSVIENYCYDEFGENTRITKSPCPPDPAATSGPIGGEDPKTSTIYGFDAFGRMSSAKAPDPASQGSANPAITTTTYSYDALDRRYQKMEDRGQGPSMLTYSYLGETSQASQDKGLGASGNAVTNTYDYDSKGGRTGAYRSDPTSTSAYHAYALDANGSVESLEGKDGSVSQGDRYHYDPYGNLEKGQSQGAGDPTKNSMSPEAALGTDAKANGYRYEGFYQDAGIGTYDMQARPYRPQSGQYLTQDSFQAALGDQQLAADPLTQNRYAFAGGNPTSNVEYDGHCGEAAAFAATTGGKPSAIGAIIDNVDPCSKARAESSAGASVGQSIGSHLTSSGLSASSASSSSGSTGSSAGSSSAAAAPKPQPKSSPNPIDQVTGAIGSALASAGSALGSGASKAASAAGSIASSTLCKTSLGQGSFASGLGCGQPALPLGMGGPPPSLKSTASSLATIGSFLIPEGKVADFAAKIPGLSKAASAITDKLGGIFAGASSATEDAAGAARGTDFIVHPNGDVLPVPRGAEGPTPAESGNGFQFKGGSGGHGLDPRTSGVRLMDPVTSGPYQYPNGYGSYFNESGQTVNPFTGQPIPRSDPFAHQGF